MRMAKSLSGFSVVVSNQEYALIRKVIASKKLPLDNLDEYHQELGNKLYRRGVLDKVTSHDEEYFIPVIKEEK